MHPLLKTVHACRVERRGWRRQRWRSVASTRSQPAGGGAWKSALARAYGNTMRLPPAPWRLSLSWARLMRRHARLRDVCVQMLPMQQPMGGTAYTDCAAPARLGVSSAAAVSVHFSYAQHSRVADISSAPDIPRFSVSLTSHYIHMCCAREPLPAAQVVTRHT